MRTGEWLVVLNRNVEYGATNATALSRDGAFAIARDYWEHAEPGERVQSFYYATLPSGPRLHCYQWVKGSTEGPPEVNA